MTGVLLRVVGGEPFSKTNRPYPPEIVDFAWAAAQRSRGRIDPPLALQIQRRLGSAALRDALSPRESVCLPSGRVRANCRYCEARNTPFQGLAADGAKDALWSLVRAGYRVVNFIHDEVLVELAEDADHLAEARAIEDIMVDAMQRYTPAIAIRVEFALMRRWYKNAQAVFDDPQNPTRLLPWEPPHAKPQP